MPKQEFFLRFTRVQLLNLLIFSCALKAEDPQMPAPLFLDSTICLSNNIRANSHELHAPNSMEDFCHVALEFEQGEQHDHTEENEENEIEEINGEADEEEEKKKKRRKVPEL